MANFVFNMALGRAVELYRRVSLNDPASSKLVVVAITTSATDAALKDEDNLQAILDRTDTDEVTNTNYVRKTFDDTQLAGTAPDDVGDFWEIKTPDVIWTNVGPGTSWTDLIFNYDGPGTNQAVNFVPLTQHDFVVVPNDTDVTAIVPAFFRAS